MLAPTMQTIRLRWNVLAMWLERGIAVATVVAVALYAFQSVQVLLAMDWSSTETFYEFINRALMTVIGIEFVRMLTNHSIAAVLELLAFVIARKLLRPELSSLDIALSVGSFVALMAARHFFMEEQFYRNGTLRDCENCGQEQSSKNH